MSDDWARITMREVRVITAAVAGRIFIRGTECACLVRDESGHWADIGVPELDDLRELLPSLHPESIHLDCAEAEQPGLRELVNLILLDRHEGEVLH